MVPLKDRKHTKDLCSLLGVQCVTDVVRYGKLRWFGRLEHKSGDEWVSSCRDMEVAEVECVGRKTWGVCGG